MRCQRPECQGCSRGLHSHGLPHQLRVVVCRLHAQDVGDDAVDLHVPNQSCKEQLLRQGSTHQPQGRQAQEQPGQPAKEGREGSVSCVFGTVLLAGREEENKKGFIFNQSNFTASGP